MYHDIRKAVVDAQLDDPRAPWEQILSQVLCDGKRFCWRDGDTLHIRVLIRVFEDLYRLSELQVRTQVRASTDDWPNQKGLPW